MTDSFSRRDFNKLASAALSGMVAGAALTGCDPSTKDKTVAKNGKDKLAAATGEKHACRGLNECKGQGADAKNACAGQGTCATVAHHGCGGQNDCKNLGGCGEKPGSNECKGQGGCGVPMNHGDAWDRARVAFETRMKAASKTVGAAPKK